MTKMMDALPFPRVSLANIPTPLELLENLRRRVGGPKLLVKRDDNTGLAMGGNKVRQLEFYLGEAVANGADTVIASGAVQSNHGRLTAAAAARLGLKCIVQLENRVPNMKPEYAVSGNVLLDELFGAEIHRFPVGEDEEAADASMYKVAAECSRQGGKPYVIPNSVNHKPLGALGYVLAARELHHQLEAMKESAGAIVLASGGANTHAGLLVGLRMLSQHTRVYGFCVRRNSRKQRERVWKRVTMLAEMMGVPELVGEGDVWVSDEFLGPGYGQLDARSLETLRVVAQAEGLLLDPVYTAKAMSGLLELVKQGHFRSDETVVFLHTGGTPALFGYGELIRERRE